MHSHFLKKFFKETLHFSGCWGLFIKKWNNESNIVIDITPHIFLAPSIEVYPATNVRKNFVTTKFWEIFKLNHPIVMGADTMFNQITFIFSKE